MTSPTARERLDGLLLKWQQLLKGWAADGRLSAAAREALQLEGEPPLLKELSLLWAAGDFSTLPPIELLSASSMPDAAGAYAISTGTIYLNQDWLLTASQAQVETVLTEELGHHLDGLLNDVDTSGDEGKMFAVLLTLTSLSYADLRRTGSDASQAVIHINGEKVIAEAAPIDSYARTFADSNPSTDNSLIDDWNSSLFVYLGGNDTYAAKEGIDGLQV